MIYGEYVSIDIDDSNEELEEAIISGDSELVEEVALEATIEGKLKDLKSRDPKDVKKEDIQDIINSCAKVQNTKSGFKTLINVFLFCTSFIFIILSTTNMIFLIPTAMSGAAMVLSTIKHMNFGKESYTEIGNKLDQEKVKYNKANAKLKQKSDLSDEDKKSIETNNKVLNLLNQASTDLKSRKSDVISKVSRGY